MRKHICKICGRLFSVNRWDMRSNTCGDPACIMVWEQQRKDLERQRARLKKDQERRTGSSLDERIQAATASGMSYGNYVAFGHKKGSATVASVTEHKRNGTLNHYSTVPRVVKSMYHQRNMEAILY